MQRGKFPQRTLKVGCCQREGSLTRNWNCLLFEWTFECFFKDSWLEFIEALFRILYQIFHVHLPVDGTFKNFIWQIFVGKLFYNEINCFNYFSTAFTSWICYYKTFSKELRHIFNLREIHMGHIANNLGLRDAPKSIVKQYSQANEGGKKER